MRLISILTFFFVLPLIHAQQADTPPPITAENIHYLQPVLTLDYTDSDVTSAFDRGWFVTSESGNLIAVPALNAEGESRLAMWYRNQWHAWDTHADIATVTLTDENPNLTVAITNGTQIRIYRRDFTANHPEMPPLYAEFATDGAPIEMWLAEDSIGMEIVVDSMSQIFHITPDAVIQHSYAPDQDASAVVRIGRIPLPYVVTSSLEGIVTLWNIDQDTALAHVDNGTESPAVFGNINASATHLVWRDNFNQSLYLMNFLIGENRLITDLLGEYAQWYFLTDDTSVVLAVNLGFRPHIYAWIINPNRRTPSRERIDLGAYRQCERPQPDMARLSVDGTTLIIGCDTGLQVWRIVEPDAGSDND